VWEGGIYEAHIVVFELRQGESPHASQGREVYLWLWSPSVELDAWVSNLESHNMNVFAGWKLGHVEKCAKCHWVAIKRPEELQ
jgi:hypothetical protein